MVNILVLTFLIALLPIQVINAAPLTKPRANSAISGTKDNLRKENISKEKLAKEKLAKEKLGKEKLGKEKLVKKSNSRPGAQKERIKQGTLNGQPQIDTDKSTSNQTNAIPSYKIEIYNSEATRDDFVWVSVTFDKVQDCAGIWIELYNDSASNEDYYIDLQRVTGLYFEGYMYISYFTEPGEYYLTTLHMYGEDYELSKSLDWSDYFNVTGTIGDNYPDLNIQYDSEVYTRGDTVGVTIWANYGLEDFDQGYLDLVIPYQDSDGYLDFYDIDDIELYKQSDGSYYGEMKIGDYDQVGFASVYSVSFFKDYGEIDFYNTEFVDGDTSNYQDFFDFYFTIKNTLKDYDDPVFLSVATSTQSIARNGSFKITVRASDATSGVESVEVDMEDSTLFLNKSGVNTWTGEYSPSPFYPEFSPIVISDVIITDFAGNYTYASDSRNFKPISIKLSGNTYVGEIFGANRYETAIQVSQYFPQSDTVILAKGTSFPDALAAGPLSYTLDAPILLCKTNDISTATLNEIKRRGAKQVLVMGGTAAISEDVVAKLKKNGIKTVRRIVGKNRYVTAIEVANELGNHVSKNWIDHVVIANGANFPDALAAGSFASYRQIPILLNQSNTLRDDVKQYLLKNKIKYVSIIGGTGVLSDGLIKEIKGLGINVARTSGSNRYNTSVEIAKKFFSGADRAVVTNGKNFADALTAAPLAAYLDAPLLLVDTNLFPAGVKTYLADLKSSNINFVTVIGGSAAVNSSIKKSLNIVMVTKQ